MSRRSKRAQQEPRSHGKVVPETSRPVPLCIYCQDRPANTVEHVIARAFFGSMQPRRAIKVPACAECNGGRGDGGRRPLTMDEEYVRTVLASELNSSNHPVAAKLLTNEVQRSFENSPGLLHHLGANMRVVNARTAQGIIIPNMPQMTIDGYRIARVLIKIVRGLFYAVNDRPLPPKWPVQVSARITGTQLKTISGMMDRWKRNTGWWNVGDEKAFTFKCAMDKPDSTASIWLLVFYQSVAFCAHTVPINSAMESREAQSSSF